MNKKKASKAPEFLWFSIAIMCLITAIHKTYYHGISNSWLFYAFTFISLAMYYIRKKMRKNTS